MSDFQPSLTAAIRHGKQTYTGRYHRDIYSKLSPEVRQEVGTDGRQFGFVDESGRYHTRSGAMQYARDFGLLHPKHKDTTSPHLIAEMLRDPETRPARAQRADGGGVTPRLRAVTIYNGKAYETPEGHQKAYQTAQKEQGRDHWKTTQFVFKTEKGKMLSREEALEHALAHNMITDEARPHAERAYKGADSGFYGMGAALPSEWLKPEHRATGGGVGRPARATGGEVSEKLHTGPIHSPVAGRTDHLPMHVPSGSYVIPADIIGAMGEGNTMAGFKHMRRMFAGAPYGGGGGPYGQGDGPYGGDLEGKAHGGSTHHVAIVAAGGEYVLSPDEVRHAGDGDLERGHRVLDEFVKRYRQKTIKTLQKLPGPAKD